MASQAEGEVEMIEFFEKQKTFQVLLGYGDIGIAQVDNEGGHKGVGFVQLSRPYGLGDTIPDSEQDDAFKIVLMVSDEAGYALLSKAVKRLGDRLGYDKYTLGDDLFASLMTELGQTRQQVRAAEYRLAEWKKTGLDPRDALDQTDQEPNPKGDGNAD